MKRMVAGTMRRPLNARENYPSRLAAHHVPLITAIGLGCNDRHSTRRLSVPPSSSQFQDCQKSRPFNESSSNLQLLQRTSNLINPNRSLLVGDEEVWAEAHELLWNGWLSQSREDELGNIPHLRRVEYSLRILDRLAAILPRGEVLFASVFDADLLNRVLLLWRRGVSNNVKHSSKFHYDESHKRLRNQMTPSFMAEKVDRYRWVSLVQPDCKTFNILLDASSDFPSRSEGVLFADSLLEKLIQLTQNEQQRAVPLVDAISISSVMHSWVQHGNVEKAEMWLERLKAWASGNNNSSNLSTSQYDDARSYLGNLRPNNIMYTTILSGYAKTGNVERALALLQEQLNEYQNGNSDARPDTQTFNTVLLAMTKSGDATSPAMADEIVQQMEEYSSMLGWECTPDDYTWSNLIMCHANIAPKRAERLLFHLERKLQQQDQQRFMPLHAYNAVLQGYANRNGAVKSAARLLHTMESSDTLIQPDERSYNIVLSAFAKCSSSNAKQNSSSKNKNKHNTIDHPPMEAEALLERMQARGIAPSTITYSHVLQCWAKYSHDPQAADRAEYWLREMELGGPPGCSKSLHPRARPNIICYNIVLTAWCNKARVFRDNSALERAARLLNELFQSHAREGKDLSSPQAERPQAHVKPTAATFRILLHGVAGSAVNDKAKRIKALVQLMEHHGFRPSPSDEDLIRRCSKR